MTKAAAQNEREPKDPGNLDFEAALKRLTHIVERLEGGDLSLEESLSLFEEGTRLSRASQARLDAAEKRVEELLRIDERGEPVVRELSPE